MRVFVHICSRTGEERAVRELEDDVETIRVLVHALEHPKGNPVRFPDKPAKFRISDVAQDKEGNFRFLAIRSVPMH